MTIALWLNTRILIPLGWVLVCTADDGHRLIRWVPGDWSGYTVTHPREGAAVVASWVALAACLWWLL